LRGFDPFSMPFDGIAHAEFEETFHEGPMTLTGGDVGQARPSDADGADDEERDPTGKGRSYRCKSPGPRSQPPSHNFAPEKLDALRQPREVEDLLYQQFQARPCRFSYSFPFARFYNSVPFYGDCFKGQER